jgi:hypothetical protein
MPTPTATHILTNHQTGMLTYRIQDHVTDLPFVLENVKDAHPDLVKRIEAPTVEIKAPFTADGKLDKVQLAALVEEAKQNAVYHASRAIALIKASLEAPQITIDDAMDISSL